jgi:hypothetical protein
VWERARCSGWPRRSARPPTTSAWSWRGRSPAHRAGTLVRSWWTLPAVPTLDRDAEGRTRPALAPSDGSAVPGAIRVMVLARVGELDEGFGVVSPDAVEDYLRWRLPLLADASLPEHLRRTWAEASRLGVVADGACTDIGRALLRRGEDALEDVLTGVLPAVQTRALIGSDLTVVVPGSPDPAVVDVLDAVAMREARGVASTWRITPASVREALDAGYSAEGVLTALETIGGQVPQALDYLVGDVGHGHPRVAARRHRGPVRRRSPARRGRGPPLAAPTGAAGSGPDRAGRDLRGTERARGAALGGIPACRGAKRQRPGGHAATAGRPRRRRPACDRPDRPGPGATADREGRPG